MTVLNEELWSVFDARRVKAPELRGLDSMANSVVGYFKNIGQRQRRSKLADIADRIELLEPEIHAMGSSRFKEEVANMRDEARLGHLEGPVLERAMAVTREACVRAVGKRPFKVQLMGALCMVRG